MSNGIVTVTIPYIQQFGHIPDTKFARPALRNSSWRPNYQLRFKVRSGARFTHSHDQVEVANTRYNVRSSARITTDLHSKISHDELDPADLTEEEEEKSQIFVRTQLLLASDNPVWLSMFHKILQSCKYRGTVPHYVAAFNRFAPAYAGPRSKTPHSTNMLHVPPELAIHFVIRVRDQNEQLTALDDSGSALIADTTNMIILTRPHDIYDGLCDQTFALQNPENLEIIRQAFIHQGPRVMETIMLGWRLSRPSPPLKPLSPSSLPLRLSSPLAAPSLPMVSVILVRRSSSRALSIAGISATHFVPPGPNRHAIVAAVPTTIDIFSHYYNHLPAPHAIGLLSAASAIQEFCDVPTDAHADDCAISLLSMTGYINDLPENHDSPDNTRIYGLSCTEKDHSNVTAIGHVTL